MKLPPPRKKWGQNFLRDGNIARKIVAAAFETEGDLPAIIEIGPGQGALTEILLQHETAYTGIEIDPELSRELQRRFGQMDNFDLIEQDFLDVDLPRLIDSLKPAPVSVIGNIPYNITSPILFKLFDNADNIQQAVIMMQKEVGERLIAGRGSKAYGLLSINAQLFADVKRIARVPAHLFFPRPRVDSVVIRLRFRRGARDSFSNFSLFRKISRHCFQHRRKMLRKSLSMLFSVDLLTKLDADLTRRPEQLSIESWQKLVAAIDNLPDAETDR